MRTITRQIARLEKAIGRPKGAEMLLPALPEQGEVADLAKHITQSLQALVEGYVEYLGLTREEALARAMIPAPGAVDSVRRLPLDKVSFSDLATLCRTDPAAALEKWSQIREAAREEHQSGARAAGAVPIQGSSPWGLAQFLAVRDALAPDWASRNGCEQLLIDRAAQVFTMLQFWQEELIDRTALLNLGRRRETGKELPQLEDAQAMEQAMKMVERLEAMLERIIMLLQKMRRDHMISRRSK